MCDFKDLNACIHKLTTGMTDWSPFVLKRLTITEVQHPGRMTIAYGVGKMQWRQTDIFD